MQKPVDRILDRFGLSSAYIYTLVEKVPCTQKLVNSKLIFSWLGLQVTTSKLEGAFMGYGAVVPDGYGVSYNLLADKIIFCVSSFFVAVDTDSRLFARHLTQTLLDMKQMLQQ